MVIGILDNIFEDEVTDTEMLKLVERTELVELVEDTELVKLGEDADPVKLGEDTELLNGNKVAGIDDRLIGTVTSIEGRLQVLDEELAGSGSVEESPVVESSPRLPANRINKTTTNCCFRTAFIFECGGDLISQLPAKLSLSSSIHYTLCNNPPFFFIAYPT